MSKLSKTLLVCSGISYLLVLIGFFLPTVWISLIFFLLHSTTLLAFTFFSVKKEEVSVSNEETESLKKQLLLAKERELECDSKIKELTAFNQKLLKQTTEEIPTSSLSTENQISNIPNMVTDPLLPPLPETGEEGATIDLIAIVEDTMKELQAFADSAGLIMQISAVQRPLYLKASALRIRILFRNIIDNSIKYMKRSGSLVITLSVVGDDIFIVLKDNGKGLPTEETPHIFELNYQGSNRISGNGLGLTQAKAIVESYGGTIYAKSTPNYGMGIYIQIPLN